MIRTLWQRWLVLARHIGSFQSRALITLLYFTLILPFGAIARFLSDPLRLRAHRSASTWLHRQTHDLTLNDARRQG